jgi:hypothetical protein
MEGIDFTDASNDEIAEAICQLHSLQVSVQARLFEAVRVFAARSGYVDDGSRSMTDWLVCSLGVSVSTARRLSETALALGQLPALEEVFSRGEVSFDQLRPLAAVATRESDEELARILPGLSAAQAESLARGLRPLTSEEEHESHRRRRLHLTHRGEMVRISGQLAAAEGELVSRALGRIAETYGPDEETGTYEPYESRLADALTQLCSTSVAADAEPDKATVVVHFGKEVLQGDGGPVFTGDGLSLSPETARRLSCDCRYQVSIDDEFGQAIGLGRMTRSFPAWLNRQLRRRDGGCRFPGCRARRLVQGHHIVFWGMGGRTDPGNTVLLCKRHHRLVHEEHWQIRGDPNAEISFIAPRGKVVSSRPMPLSEDLYARFFGADP